MEKEKNRRTFNLSLKTKKLLTDVTFTPKTIGLSFIPHQGSVMEYSVLVHSRVVLEYRLWLLILGECCFNSSTLFIYSYPLIVLPRVPPWWHSLTIMKYKVRPAFSHYSESHLNAIVLYNFLPRPQTRARDPLCQACAPSTRPSIFGQLTTVLGTVLYLATSRERCEQYQHQHDDNGRPVPTFSHDDLSLIYMQNGYQSYSIVYRYIATVFCRS